LKDLTTLSKDVAREIIERVGSSGQPPEYGFQFFTVGLDSCLHVMEEEYLSSYIREFNGKAFKMVVGSYGGGKTHFLYCIRELAWKYNFVVSYVELSEKTTPFYQLENVYRAIVSNMMCPLSPEELLSGYEKGIDNLLKIWFQRVKTNYEQSGLSGDNLNTELIKYADSIKDFDSISFTNAVKQAFRAILERRDADLTTIMQWLRFEGFISGKNGHPRFGILQRIDKSNAFSLIRSTVQWVKQMGYSGLIILFDETEQTPSLSGKQKNTLFSNLVEMINECGRGQIDNSMFFYAVPNEDFLEKGTGIYEALKQRLDTVFDIYNPTGVKVRLENIPGDSEANLIEIGYNLAKIFQKAYTVDFDNAVLQESIKNVASLAYEHRWTTGSKRYFVQKVINALYFLRGDQYTIVTRERIENSEKS